MKFFLTHWKRWLPLPAVALLTVGCATGRNAASQALVCPECETVLLETSPAPVLSPDEEGVFYSSSRLQEGERHDCPGCQGALVTLFKEGKLKHTCTVCTQGAFNCPVNHR